MSLMSMFPGGGGTNNQPLKAPTNLKAEMNTTTSVQITWTDPENEYSQPSGALIGEWMFTRIVRKVGSAPVNANDGELIVESAVKNQYQTTPYIDSSNIVTGTTYYYAAFAFTKSRVSSPGAIFKLVANWYDPVLSNNTWTMIKQAFNEGVAQDVWSKGDTKTDNGISYTLELFNPTVFPLSDGSGYPRGLFVTTSIVGLSKYANTTYDNNSGVDSYTESILKTVIDNRYSSMSAELKNLVVPVNVNLYKITGYNGYNEAYSVGLETVSSLYTFPLSLSAVTSILPTAESRTKHDIYGWWLGDLSPYSRMVENNHYEYKTKTARIVDTHGVVDHYPPSIQSYDGIGVVYGFCL